MKYVELPHNKKINLLNDHDGGDWVNLEQSKWCLHCSRSFTGLSVRVQEDEKGKYWLECGTPGCDGSPIDWAPYPWWDPEHPAAKEYFERHPEEKRKHDEGTTDDEAGDDDIPF
jgi:hypothetical protein